MGLGTFLREFADTVLGPFSSFVGCLGGLIGGGLTELQHLGGGGSRLSGRTKGIMGEFFPDVDLDDVRIKTSASVPFGHRALTLDHRIYFADGFDECNIDDMRTLMHELVHVRQYEARGWAGFMCEYGREWLDRGYELAWMEVEAERFEHDHADRLEELVVGACGAQAAQTDSDSSDEAFWMLWGGHA